MEFGHPVDYLDYHLAGDQTHFDHLDFYLNHFHPDYRVYFDHPADFLRSAALGLADPVDLVALDFGPAVPDLVGLVLADPLPADLVSVLLLPALAPLALFPVLFPDTLYYREHRHG